ncbi:MAG TPA: type III-B CRISPR module-associated protein Cmr5 [Gemmataceae bacterium]|nr:type III-B CRISPR module-associated protein Cmr5 [Gemmataceae bacterium]
MAETTSHSTPTLDQRRANHAWKAIISQATVKDGQRQYDDKAKEYAREARKLPTRILSAGLGQALAFILAKAKDKKPNLKRLHEDLTDWVIRQRPMSAKKPNSLIESIIEGDSDFLRRATDEVLAYLLWLNRFAEAEGLTEGEE